MLTEIERTQVVEALLAANKTKVQTTRPSALFPHIEFEDAYAISAEVAKRTVAVGARLIGYKVGLTSIAMRRSSKIDEPDFGFLYDHFLIEDGAKVPHANYCVPRVELELAFILGAPLQGPGITLLDVLRATEFVLPSIEIIDTRVDEPRQIYDTIADNGAGAGIVLGGRPYHPRDLDLRMVPGILYRNTDIEETGLSCGVMGHPANGVAWLANKLSTLGYALEPGQMLLAGSFVRPVWANIGDTIRADFGKLGSVAIQFI
ncbi:2-oxo-hepta-3-ene-1,7-dioate hydratase [Candidatus Leptofilum sp.]|uniref:2-oxo-hepta-3-ene-1,7-dioate hydratase n=1 Tax=Candidatus Leptofilum sp. TaxID=3241576 RepID=UPI003B594202